MSTKNTTCFTKNQSWDSFIKDFRDNDFKAKEQQSRNNSAKNKESLENLQKDKKEKMNPKRQRKRNDKDNTLTKLNGRGLGQDCQITAQRKKTRAKSFSTTVEKKNYSSKFNKLVKDPKD